MRNDYSHRGHRLPFEVVVRRLDHGDGRGRTHSAEGPEVLEITDVPAPTPGPGQQLCDVSTAGINYADTHHRPS